jgi:hypothetical protein
MRPACEALAARSTKKHFREFTNEEKEQADGEQGEFRGVTAEVFQLRRGETAVRPE